MLALGILIGIYSYVILALGLLGFINYTAIISVTFLFLFFAFYLSSKKTHKKEDLKVLIINKNNKYVIACISPLVLVNLMGVLGPELAFDALWYHLTIPKIFIENNHVFFIKGNLFYYSLMPKLTEMLYLSSLVLSNEILAKFIHFMFGILTMVVTYKIARLYIDKFYSLLAVLIFYSNLVVGWLSITAFVDLPRAFYESLALLYLLLFAKKRDAKYIFYSSLFLGFAISTKLLALLSIPIFILLILLIKKFEIKKKILFSSLFLSVSLIVPMPWFVISYINTNNPIYPLLSTLYPQYINLSLLDPKNFFDIYAKFFVYSSDPISPIYIIALPFLIINLKNLFKNYKDIVLYSIFALAILYVTPPNGGGRFVVAFLPAFSILVSILIYLQKDKIIKKALLASTILIFSINLSYRVAANVKYIPVVLSFQTKENFLMNNLNFSFGDFYDEKGEIKKIVGNDMVLLIGMHNLYYVDFEFTIQEWGEKNIEYVLVQEGELPSYYKNSQLVYENKKTNVKLFKINND